MTEEDLMKCWSPWRRSLRESFGMEVMGTQEHSFQMEMVNLESMIMDECFRWSSCHDENFLRKGRHESSHSHMYKSKGQDFRGD